MRKRADDKTAEDDRGMVIALARGLSILRCFSADRPELGPTDLASMLGLPQPTVWRLCQTLQKLGFLAPGHTHDKLCVGEAVLRLGHAVAANSSLVEYAYPLMREIAVKYGVSVSLSSRFGPDMLIVQRVAETSILQLNLHVGSAYEVMNSAAGWAYLSGLSSSDRRQVMEEIRSERPENFAAYRANVREALAQFEAEGYVVGLGKMHPLINAVGVPVVSANRQRVMAINCGGVSLTCTPELIEEKLGPAMRQLADKLSARLGVSADVQYNRN